jgi:hypothetical protein
MSRRQECKGKSNQENIDTSYHLVVFRLCCPVLLDLVRRSSCVAAIHPITWRRNPMKCIRPSDCNGPIRRVSDAIAQREVDAGFAVFVPKAEWKKQEKNKVLETLHSAFGTNTAKPASTSLCAMASETLRIGPLQSDGRIHFIGFLLHVIGWIAATQLLLRTRSRRTGQHSRNTTR